MMIVTFASICITYANLMIFGAQDVCPVSGAVHPCVNYRFGSGLTGCDVFTGSSIMNTKGFHHVKR